MNNHLNSCPKIVPSEVHNSVAFLSYIEGIQGVKDRIGNVLHKHNCKLVFKSLPKYLIFFHLLKIDLILERQKMFTVFLAHMVQYILVKQMVRLKVNFMNISFV